MYRQRIAQSGANTYSRRVPDSGIPAYSKKQYKESDITPTQDSSVRHVAEVYDRQEFFSRSLGLLQIGPAAVGSTLPVAGSEKSKIAITPSPSGFYQVIFMPVTPVLTANDASLVLAKPLANFGTPTTGGNTIGAGMPQPNTNALASVFPWQWLQNLAQNYEEWQIKSLSFEWIPLCPYTTLGQIVLSFTPDATAVPDDFNTYQAMMSTVAAVSGSVWAAVKLDVPLASTNMPDGWKTVQSANDTSALQATLVSGASRGGLQQFFAGYFMAAFEGISSSIAAPLPIPALPVGQTSFASPNVFIPLGTLKATYSICLRAPVFMSNPLVTNDQLDTLVSHFGSDEPTPLMPFGHAGESYSDGGARVMLSPYRGSLGTSQTFLVPPGQYQAVFMLQGTGIIAVTVTPAALGNGIDIFAPVVSTVSLGAFMLGFVHFTSSADYTSGSMLANLIQFDVTATSLTHAEIFFNFIASTQD